MRMPIEHALLLHCHSAHIAKRIVGVYAGLLALEAFPFRFQIHVNPSPLLMEELTRTRRCLFYHEIGENSTAADFELMEMVNRVYRPHGHQLVLIAEPVADYLDLAIRFEVGNILFSDSIEASTVRALTHRLLGSDFFGFGPFFPEQWDGISQQHTFTGKVDRAGIVDRTFGLFLQSLHAPYRHLFHGQMSELLTNAFAYGVLEITPEERDANILHIPTIIEIPPDKEVRITLVQDKEKYGISVIDPGGSLTLLRILQKLRRHTPAKGEPLPIGIDDLTGRGLFIVSRQSRVVINILRGKCTEVILLGYFNENRNCYKSLIINEKYPTI